MYKKKILVQTEHDARRELDVLQTDIGNATLAEQSKILLIDQLETALKQFEKQLSLNTTRELIADRLFEGDGYEVIIRVRTGGDGFMSKLKNMLGL